MTQLLAAHEHDIDEIAVVPSTGGVFEVEVDGDLLYTKSTTGRHAEEGEVLGLLTDHLER